MKRRRVEGNSHPCAREVELTLLQVVATNWQKTAQISAVSSEVMSDRPVGSAPLAVAMILALLGRGVASIFGSNRVARSPRS